MMARKRRRATGLVSIAFLVVLAVVAGVAVAIWRGAGPLPDPEGCEATVAGRHVTLEPTRRLWMPATSSRR